MQVVIMQHICTYTLFTTNIRYSTFIDGVISVQLKSRFDYYENLISQTQPRNHAVATRKERRKCEEGERERYYWFNVRPLNTKMLDIEDDVKLNDDALENSMPAVGPLRR